MFHVAIVSPKRSMEPINQVISEYNFGCQFYKYVYNDLSDIASLVDTEVIPPSKKAKYKKPDDVDRNQMSLFATNSDNDIIDTLRNLDLTHMTPIEALNRLYDLQSQVKNRW